MKPFQRLALRVAERRQERSHTYDIQQGIDALDRSIISASALPAFWKSVADTGFAKDDGRVP